MADDFLTSRECPICDSEIYQVTETERKGLAWACVDGHAGHVALAPVANAPAFDFREAMNSLLGKAAQ